jgi:ElaB/YqjD/DUF883 family membrane-anchored ribosome-binding protein
MAKTYDPRDDLSDTATQISRLREKVEMLMSERVTPALAQASEQAETALHNAQGAVRDGASAVSGRVREQPLIALLVASGVGFLLGRILR